MTWSKAMSPRIAGREARWASNVGSGWVLRMSPMRSTEMRTCWKSCHSWASRSTGLLTRAASMLNATSSPTVSEPSIASRAPKNRHSAMVSLLISAAIWLATLPRCELAHARHRIADPARLEVGDRQRHQMAVQPRPELDVDAVGGVREHVGPQAAEHDLEHRDHHQPDDQHLERAEAAMHQHLVDHDL